MCGIAGYWNARSGRPAGQALIRSMTRTLTHRGPDEEGYWIEGSLGLGMRRLRVVDPEGGHQPMANEDGTVQVVYNGEIYNHRDLRLELEGKGHRFRTRSDTEVIAHAFEEWGEGCVRRFNGMFAFAAWDSRRRRLLLARDRLGIKPLYVHQGPQGVVFGSELKAVVAAPWVDLEWDFEAVDDFMTYEYVPAPRSIVRDVTKLPQGTTLLIEDGVAAPAEPRRFWRLEAGPPPVSPEAAERGLRERLAASVRRRLMADVPLGAFLSGGIDSSIIVALMSAETPGRVRSFSLGFRERSYDELPYARLVAGRFGSAHREEVVGPEIVDSAASLAALFDEPFGDVSAFPTYLISSLAKREVTVALSGDGGDELFAGYDHYRAHRWAHRLRALSASRGWRVADRLLAALPPTSSKKGMVNVAKRFAEGLRRPADLEHARWWVFWDLAERRACYQEDLRPLAEGRDPFEYYRARLREAGEAGFTGLARQLYADVTGYLADDILVKLDRMSMAVSLEARVPFLDHEVVEFAMNIPDGWKLADGESKWILRRAFGDLLPERVRRRGKEGFSIPLKNWLAGPLRPLLSELLSERRLGARGWFRPSEVRRLIDEHLAGRQNHAHRLWCLMSLELSLQGLERRVLERAAPAREVAS
jgi:asparagine synthase (glutamine-hydrolysing)